MKVGRLIPSLDLLEAVPPVALRLLRSAGAFRALAARARRRSDRAADAFYRRQACEVQPGNGANWMQLGHALKELGFHDRARDAYTCALSLLPGSSDIQLELAHLAKMRGEFDEAARCFAAAVGAGAASPAITSELALLARIDNAAIHPAKIAGLDEEGVHVYLSAPVASIRENSRDTLSAGLGKSDYSYAFAMRGFVAALELLRRNFTVLANPEFVSDVRERSNARYNIHLGFYPPERMRLLKGAYNINCFAWEFDRLRAPGELLSYHAFADQATMLDLADELWVPSAHGAGAVARDVSKPVHAVPAPILNHLQPAPREGAPDTARVRHLAQELRAVPWEPLAVFARIQPAMDEEARRRESRLPDIMRRLPTGGTPTIFLTILNVHDFRKQLQPMLQGFLEFQLKHPDAILLVKLTTPDRGKQGVNSFLLMDQIFNAGELPRPLVSDRVWITDAILSREELNRLYDAAAFYVCTSYAEGQNLPLLEAMGRGVVPVSVDHTAMADYVGEETSVPIRSERRPLGPRLSARYGLYGLQTNFVDAADVAQALSRAAALAPADYASRSACALALVKRDYGADRIAGALDRIVASLKADSHG